MRIGRRSIPSLVKIAALGPGDIVRVDQVWVRVEALDDKGVLVGLGKQAAKNGSD